jgi:hypothetical protein
VGNENSDDGNIADPGTRLQRNATGTAQASLGPNWRIEVTRFAKAGGPLTKEITLGANGGLVSDPSQCLMNQGTAERVILKSLAGLAALIGEVEAHEAITLGALRADLPDSVSVTTRQRLAWTPTGTHPLIARTGEYLLFYPKRPAFALLDFDTKGMPEEIAARLDEVGSYWQVLLKIIPELGTAGRLVRASTSAGLVRTDTGEKLPGSNGLHVYVPVWEGTDVERFLKTLHNRCWLAGFGWMTVGAGGQQLERSIVDRMVGAPERLVFEGPPVLGALLAQDEASRCPIVSEGNILDTSVTCPPLSIVEQAELKELRAKEAHRLAPERAVARRVFVGKQAPLLAARIKVSVAQAAKIIERQCDGILLPQVPLIFDDPALSGATGEDVLADPVRFEGATLADPLEGIDYGPCKAKIMLRPDGTPWIHSFAHGRTIYELKLDAQAGEANLNRVPQAEVADAFVRIALAADLDDDELEKLKEIAAHRSGIGKQALNRKLKVARQQQIKRHEREERDRQAAERSDPRPPILAPTAEAPWLTQMQVLNEVLGKSSDLEPPMRDIDGVVVRVRIRRLPKMHMFTALGANDDETAETRLPPAEQPLLTRLSEAELAELIERHIDYIDNKGRSVHLGSAFVHHFHTRSDDALPLAVSVATLPIVLDGGVLLAGRGLDREHGIVFRIPSELSDILPTKEDCTASAVAAAMRFLTDLWLCDVATNYTGKCILIAAALTVIERSLLPDRPTFWVTGGRRGGGKTTTIIMLLVAVTGIRPAAAAWSPNEEERRKALLAYLLEALPAIVWDNIPRGTQIACAHIEKSCTAAFYSDRKLGVSETIATSAATIHFFTGNNIGPRGDLTSRSLRARLEVDRPDPENRPFSHPDPIAWTDAHRGQILRALYTILLGNPLFRANSPVTPQTRFKTWSHLIGCAVEFAAQEHKEHVAAFVMDAMATCPPASIRFKDLFFIQEEEDEESSSLADVLAVLAKRWPNETLFKAADVAAAINTEWLGDSSREDWTTIREFLFPRVPANEKVSAKATGKRLKRHVDEPVPSDDKSLSLQETCDLHTKILSFYVAVRPIPA